MNNELAHFKFARKRDRDAEAHLLRGSILTRMGQRTEAAGAFEAYLGLHPDADNADALQEYIRALKSGG